MSEHSPRNNPECHETVQRLSQILIETGEGMHMHTLHSITVKGVKLHEDMLKNAKDMISAHCSDDVWRLWQEVVCERSLTNEPEWQFLAILVWESYMPEGRWTLGLVPKLWDAKVLDILNRFFPYDLN